ncbi:hypothetical protein DFH29DRAFT_995221 [Suillus ampliporus]|nr:hypothetical protein DFH29DRAFT_995221 [Suillus ampliporus]
MSSSDTLPKTEKYPHEKLTLDGSNYSQWATGFKMWAGGIRLWSYVSGDEIDPSPPALLTDPDQNIICKEKHDFVYLCDIDDPHIAWDRPGEKYIPQKAIQFNQYLDCLFTLLKAHDSASIAEMLQTLIVLKSDLAALSVASSASSPTPTAISMTPVPPPQRRNTRSQMPSLCISYSELSPTIMTLSAKHSLTELHHAGTNSMPEHVAMLSGHRGNSAPPKTSDHVPPKGFDESKGDGWICRARLTKDEKKSALCSSPAAVAANTESPLADQPDEPVTSPPFILTLKDHSASISSTLDLPDGMFHVDSAATAHMEPEISRFSHYIKLREPIRVTLADEHVVLAPGWGKVRLALRYGTSLTERDFEFLHIPDLWCTLISVSTLASARISFTTSSKGGTLRSDDGDGPCLAHVHLKGGLYLLDAAYCICSTPTPMQAMLSQSPSLPSSLNTWHNRLCHVSWESTSASLFPVLHAMHTLLQN